MIACSGGPAIAEGHLDILGKSAWKNRCAANNN